MPHTIQGLPISRGFGGPSVGLVSRCHVACRCSCRRHRSRSGVTRVTRRRARGPTRVPWSWAPRGPGGTVEEEANATMAHREASPRSRYKHGPRRREEFTSFLLLARFLSIGAVEVGFVFRKRLKCSKATDDWSWSSLLIKLADARLTARRVPVRGQVPGGIAAVP